MWPSVGQAGSPRPTSSAVRLTRDPPVPYHTVMDAASLSVRECAPAPRRAAVAGRVHPRGEFCPAKLILHRGEETAPYAHAMRLRPIVNALVVRDPGVRGQVALFSQPVPAPAQDGNIQRMTAARTALLAPRTPGITTTSGH